MLGELRKLACQYHYHLSAAQRVRTALRAISRRYSGENFSTRNLPPFEPPFAKSDRMEILLMNFSFLSDSITHRKNMRIGRCIYSTPVSSQSTLTLNSCFTRSKTSAGGKISPLSYFESWLWLIPNCSANASCVRSNPRSCLSRLPTALK
jgi:hypothetical protein